jgi:hypothetical protein
MTTHILSLAEWEKERGECPIPVLPHVHPANIAIVVVRDDEGTPIAHMYIYRVSCMEGVWIAPKHRGNPGVARALLRQTYAISEARDERWTFAMAADETMRNIVSRLQGAELPVTLHVIPTGGGLCQPQ